MLRSAIHAARPGALLRQALARGARPAIGAAAVSARRIGTLAPTSPSAIGASVPSAAAQDPAKQAAPATPGEISQVRIGDTATCSSMLTAYLRGVASL